MTPHSINRITQILSYSFLVLACSLLLPNYANAQNTFPINGVQDQRDEYYAFTNATIYISHNQKTEKATLLIRKGRVEAVGTALNIPKGAVSVDMKGKYIYPSLIDIYSSYGLPEATRKQQHNMSPQMVSSKKGAFGWNEAIKPEINAADIFTPDDKAAKTWREQGFGVVLSHAQDGIARGCGTLVTLGNEPAQNTILKDRATAHYSFEKGTSTQDYPDSEMGSIALLRQTYLDAQWYAKAAPKGDEYNISLDAWNKTQNLPQIFETHDWLSALRADKIGDEFGVSYIIKGTGDEYRRTAELKATGATFIIPLNFPDAYDVEDPLDAQNVSWSEMKHWELAPANLAALEKSGINFALTAAQLKDPSKFWKNLKQAVKQGLSKEAALKALTTTPAALVGMQGQIGSLETGKWANFIITSGELLDDKTEIYENWIKGKPYIIKEKNATDTRGYYTLKAGNIAYKLDISGDSPSETKAEIAINDSLKIPVSINLQEQNINISFDTAKDSTRHQQSGKGFVRLSGWISSDAKQWKGKGQLADSKWVEWTAVPREAPKKDDKDKKEDKGKTDDKDKKEDKDKKDDKDKADKLGSLSYPFLPYGWTEMPKTETILFKNATIWTNESDGILTDSDVLIKDGKIAQIGKNLSAQPLAPKP